MGKRRAVISYRDTARLAVGGGALAIVAIAGAWALPTESVAESIVGMVGTAAWFVGTASGVLSLSTPFRKTGGAGLVMSAVAVVSLLAIRYAEEQGMPRDQVAAVIGGMLVFLFFVVPTYFVMDRYFRRRGEDEWGGPPG